MRALLGIASLLVALAIVGLVATKQLKASRSFATVDTGGAPVQLPAASGNVAQQSQQLQQQVKQQVETLMQQAPARAEPPP